MNPALGLLTALLLAPLPALPAADASRPNILFIIADDLGWGDLRCYGNPVIDTPTLDGLAKAGVRFTDHYSPSSLCAPARAGFLTGRYNHRTGAVDVPSNRGLDRLDLSEKTFGDYFRHAGYATTLIGKWHNGAYSQDYLPHRRGFDLFFGFPNGGQDYWKWNLLRNDAAVPHDGRYLTDALNDEAITFIREHAAKPFALWLAHHAPHGPLQAPEALVQKYQKRLGKDGTQAVAITYAMIEAMDTRWLACSRRSRTRAYGKKRSSFSPATTAPCYGATRNSVRRCASTASSPARRSRSWKEASACPALSPGPVTSRAGVSSPLRCKAATGCPLSTASQDSLRQSVPNHSTA